MIIVFFFNDLICSKIKFSVFTSNELVASSITMISLSWKKVLAIAKRLFWPPDNLTPDSPILVLIPLGKVFINCFILA